MTKHRLQSQELAAAATELAGKKMRAAIAKFAAMLAIMTAWLSTSKLANSGQNSARPVLCVDAWGSPPP